MSAQFKTRADQICKRIARVMAQWPEATAVPQGAHFSLEVRRKRFGWLLVDHHHDGRIAVNCKASADLHDLLKQVAPSQFHIPKFLGQKGWIGLWLDVPKSDWPHVEMALLEAYKRTAPKTLAAQVTKGE